MTREEAIHILDNLKPTNTKSSFDAYVVREAITMAIKALSQEPMIFKSSVIMDAEKTEKLCHTIKRQIKEGVVLLPYYIDSISPYEPKTEQEIREELYKLSTYRLPNSDTDLVTLNSVYRVLNLVFRGHRDIEPYKESEE